MNRGDFQKLALVRLRESISLLKSGKSDGAYYLAGYAVECAMKACVAKRTKRYDFPPDPNTARDYYTHNIEALLRSSHLKADHDDDNVNNPTLRSNWAIVRDWNESSRYGRWSRKQARDLINAIASEPDGVLAWIKQRW